MFNESFSKKELISSEGEQDKKKDSAESAEGASGLDKLAQGAMFAAALGGAGAVVSESVEAAPSSSRYEQKELFSAERETQAFIERIDSLQVGIDDARGRQALQRKIIDQFNLFTLSFSQRKSYFSTNETTSLHGVIDPSTRAQSAQYLLLKLNNINNKSSSLKLLEAIVRAQAFSAPAQTPTESTRAKNPSTTERGDIEVRRSRNFNNF